MSIIREVLERKGGSVVTVADTITILEAIATMSEANIGAVVVEQNGQAAGIFTERDYLRKVALQGRASSDTAVPSHTAW